MSRLLKPGGHLVLSVPFLYPVHESPHDYWRLTPHGLESSLRSTHLVPLYIHAKGGPVATLLSLSVNVVVRATNALSKWLRLSRRLSDRQVVRWLLALPQWVYLRVLGRNKVRKRRAWIGELELWMAPGYVVVARRDPIS